MSVRRVLLVVNDCVWPADSGNRQRAAAVAEALTTVGSLDIVALPPHPCLHAASDTPVAVDRSLELVATRRSRWRDALRWLFSRRPWALTASPRRRWRRDFRIWQRAEPYDLVWFHHLDGFLCLGRDMRARRVVVDLDNLESQAIEHRLALGDASALRRALWRVDRHRWQRVERFAARRADVTVVCSDLDRARLNAGTVLVVPNGAWGPTHTAPSIAARPVSPRRVVMIGQLTYPPNLDAVRFFAGAALPALRAQVHDVVFRVVGRLPSTGAPPFGDGDAVSFAGHVDDVADELRAASIVVVPIRFGGGTRIKILEAFAHGVPVVSTSIGCEGLDVEPGRHLLVADDPRDFAAACAQLLVDDELAARLATAARALYDERYTWNHAVDIVRGEAERLMSCHGER